MVSLQKKRVALVHPRGFNWFPGRRDITDIANRMVPQGMLSIAAYLIREGHDVFVYDCLGPGAPVDLDKQVQGNSCFQTADCGVFSHDILFSGCLGYRRKDQETKFPNCYRLRWCPRSALREDLLAFCRTLIFAAGEGEHNLWPPMLGVLTLRQSPG